MRYLGAVMSLHKVKVASERAADPTQPDGVMKSNTTGAAHGAHAVIDLTCTSKPAWCFAAAFRGGALCDGYFVTGSE